MDTVVKPRYDTNFTLFSGVPC
ncbi:MAG TPA: hypothetical protein LFW21_02580 [Rickettsia endosymbiont of Pyrocoelia pectoralis]|nr:hypothetical protein [Rickettsia endosymbiont of Pyrocoelia pectoralis]